MHLQIWKHINGFGVIQIWYGTLFELSDLYDAHTGILLNKMILSPCSACNVKWLGLRGDDLQLIPESAFQELKPRDSQIAKSLLSSKFLQVCIYSTNANCQCLMFDHLALWLEAIHLFFWGEMVCTYTSRVYATSNLSCFFGCRRVTELSWRWWWRVASVRRSKPSTPTGSISWGSTSRERLYRATTSDGRCHVPCCLFLCLYWAQKC